MISVNSNLSLEHFSKKGKIKLDRNIKHEITLLCYGYGLRSMQKNVRGILNHEESVRII